jgi:RNA-directed DNA polymerase
MLNSYKTNSFLRENPQKFQPKSGKLISEINAKFRQARRYHPQPIKRVEIPKGPKQTRPLGIPAVKDRIVQTAVKISNSQFESRLKNKSFL